MDTKRKQALHLLQRLAEAHGAPGREGAVRRIFREELPAGVRPDRSGNIIFEKTGTGANPRIMLTSHMDEVGFVVQAITKSGMLKFLPLGGWWPHALLAQRVRILTRQGVEVIGVIGAKPPHFLSEAEREKLLKIDEMLIDIGAQSAEEVRSDFGILPGDPIVPDSGFQTMHNPDLLLCKAFDNRSGSALVIHAMQLLLDGMSHPNAVVAVGTVQEEVGTRGAQTAAFSVNPDAAIVVEGSPADDFPGIPEDERQGALGHGVQIRIQDPSAIMNRPFVQLAIETAETHGISYQLAVRKGGGTDARPIQLHASGVPTVVLGVPGRYIHTHNSIIHMNDYLSTLELILKLVQSLDQAAVDRFTAFDD